MDSHNRVNKYFKAFKSKNILAIVDFYGGNMLRGVEVKENKNGLTNHAGGRIAITSGGNFCSR